MLCSFIRAEMYIFIGDAVQRQALHHHQLHLLLFISVGWRHQGLLMIILLDMMKVLMTLTLFLFPLR